MEEGRAAIRASFHRKKAAGRLVSFDSSEIDDRDFFARVDKALYLPREGVDR